MPDARVVPVPCDDAGDMPLHLWLPAAGAGPGILLIQEIFGVGPYIRAVAERLTGAGYVVGAPEVFWRFAPGWEASHDQAGLEASLEKMRHLNPVKAAEDCTRALAVLAGLDEVEGAPGVLGFCLGGSLAWAVAAGAEPAVCISYYGSSVPSMLDQLDRITCPTLVHFGSADPYVPIEGVKAVQAAAADRSNVEVNVEDAGHAFDNHESAMFYQEAAARSAWTKTMALLGEHLPAV